MEMAVYVAIIGALYAMSSGKSGKTVLRHGRYTRPIQPAVYRLCECVLGEKSAPASDKATLLYGSRDPGHMRMLHLSVKLSTMLMFMIFPAVSAVLMGDGLAEAGFAILLPPMGYVLPDLELKSEIKKRRNGILRDFPVFCTDLAIMSSAGMDIAKAWEMAVAAGGKSEFYREAGLALLRNRSGIGMTEAIGMFSDKLAVPEVHTFASVVTQAINEGGDMSSMLADCAKRSWVTREAEAGKKAEEASARAVFPLVLGLMGILVVLAAPAVLMMKGV